MAVAKVFQSGNSQAVRIPREFQFDVAGVEIERQGDETVLRPLARNPAAAFAALADMPEDFFRGRPSGHAAANARRPVMALAALRDTHICFTLHASGRPRWPSVLRTPHAAPGSPGMSLITRGELCFGADKSLCGSTRVRQADVRGMPTLSGFKGAEQPRPKRRQSPGGQWHVAVLDDRRKVAGGCDRRVVMRDGQAAGFCGGCEYDVDVAGVVLDPDRSVVGAPGHLPESQSWPPLPGFADRRKNAGQTRLGNVGDRSPEGADA